MKFDNSDGNDLIIQEFSLEYLNYPNEIWNAPNKIGVYIFFDDNEKLSLLSGIQVQPERRYQVKKEHN